MKFIGFSLRNFKRDGGGSIRMYGILNTLAAKGHEVIFISNATNFTTFHPNIKHIQIGHSVKPINKAIFQAMIGLLSPSIASFIFPALITSISKAFKRVDSQIEAKYIFFEHLDNTIGYVLKKIGIVPTYCNDLHGIATLEFLYQKKLSKNIIQKVICELKYQIALIHDTKVNNSADELIYASKEMKVYFEEKYMIPLHKKNCIIPNLLESKVCERTVDIDLKNCLIEKYQLKNSFVFFFAGGYKQSAGIEDLIEAFNKIAKKFPNQDIRLLLIGTGPTYAKCMKIIDSLNISDKIIIIERVPYHLLLTYQDLSNVIVNPDRQNPYSNIIVHLKYLDALVSGKIVINPEFLSVKEINVNEELSIGFEPSNFYSLVNAMEETYLKYDKFKNKFEKTKEFACSHLTYSSWIHLLTNCDC